MRLFCAIEPSVELRERLLDVPLATGARGFRLVDPTQLHLTLRFLGEVDGARWSEVADALARAVADSAAFTIAVHGAGAFSHRGRPRVLWAGVEDAGALAALARAVDAALDPIVGARGQPFKAHLTLGRAKRHAAVDRDALAAVGELGLVRVDELVLFESTLSARGAEHTARARLPLQNP